MQAKPLTSYSSSILILSLLLSSFPFDATASVQSEAVRSAEEVMGPSFDSAVVRDVPVESQEVKTDPLPDGQESDSFNGGYSSLLSDSSFAMAKEVSVKVPSSERSEIDSATGALLYEIPFIVPPGRNGIEPPLSLSYSSYNDDEGSFTGYGWELSIPYIKRLNKSGVEDLYTADQYYSSFSGELVKTTVASSTYSAKAEDGPVLHYEFLDNRWFAQDEKGIRYTFGTSAAERQDNATNTNQVYRWLLSEIRDQNDNFVTYSYFKEDGAIYPSSITYTHNASSSGLFSVNFLRELRSDIATSSESGFLTITKQRLKEVEIRVGGVIAKKYSFSYASGNNSQRSLLSSLTETAYDETSSTTVALPAAQFGYQTMTPGWVSTNDFSVPEYTATSSDAGVRFADVNGDGLADMLKGQGSVRKVSLNLGQSWNHDGSWQLPESFVNESGTDLGTRVFDINGDNLADIVRGTVENGIDYKKVYLNTGSGWLENPAWTLPLNFIVSYGDAGVRLADQNGDGLVDLWWEQNFPLSPGQNNNAIYLNNGDGTWTLSSQLVPGHILELATSSGQYQGTDEFAEIVDVNGDGLADFLNNGGNNVTKTYLNTGTGFVDDPTWYSPVLIDKFTTRFTDFNGDGLPDIIIGQQAYLNTGSGWARQSSWDTPIDFYDGTVLADIDGDGLSDLVRRNLSDHQRYLNRGNQADLLTSATTQTGGITSFVYKPSTAFRDQGGVLLNPDLPLVLDTVYQVGANDGVQSAATTTYEYLGGDYYFRDALNRKFSGFGQVIKTDPQSQVEKIYLHQGNASNSTDGEYQDHVAKAGKPYRIEQYDGISNLYRTVVNQWDIVDNDNDSQPDPLLNWYSSNWPYRVKLTIDNTKVDGDISDFPIYVNLANLPSSFHSHVRSDGGDIRVTRSDGKTELPRELVRYDATTDTGELHTLYLGSLANATNTDLYIYYGNAGATDYATSSPFGRNKVWEDYYSVQHRQSDEMDSTGKTAWSDVNSPSYNSGKLGGGIDFGTNTNKYSYQTGIDDLYNTDLTVQQWLSPNATPTTGQVWPPFEALFNSSKAFGLYYQNDSGTLKLQWYKQNYSGGNSSLVENTTLQNGTWYLQHWVYTNNTRFEAFRDGISKAAVSNPPNSSSGISSSQLTLGSGSGGYFASIKTDEFRVRKNALSTAWISTEYNNQNSPATFYAVGSEENAPAAASTTGSNLVRLTRETQLSYDGDSDHKDKAIGYRYGTGHGELTEKTEWGEVTGNSDGTFSDTGTDKFVTGISYATSTASSTFAFHLPSRENTVDQSSAKVRELKTYYDTLSSGLIGKGNPTKVEQWKGGSSYVDTEKTYNALGLVIEEKDPRDKVTSYAYDSHNLYPATTTNALSQSSSYSYDYSSGKVKRLTDPNGFVFETIYDARDRVLEERQPDLASPATLVAKTGYLYSDTLLPSIRRADYQASGTSTVSHSYFDGFGRVIQERRQTEDQNLYVVKDTRYDSLGRKERESLPYLGLNASSTVATTTDNLFLRYRYDPLGRIKEVANVTGTTSTSYDQWTETVTDANGHVKNFTRDAHDNLASVTEHDGGNTYTTTYLWNYGGTLAKLTDALSNVRNFTYDGLGRRLSAEDLHAPADSSFGTWSYSYDDSGNLTERTDPKNQTVNYVYDDINRPLSENYTGAGGTEVVYGYDTCSNGLGRLCTATTSAAVSSYSYNPLGLIAAETKTINSNAYATSYDYDRQGNKTLITYPDNSAVRHGYNIAGQLEHIEQRESGGSFKVIVADFDYGPHGAVTYQLNGNGTETTKTYDPNELYRLRTLYTATTTQFGIGGGGAEHSTIEMRLSALAAGELSLDEVFAASGTDPIVLPSHTERPAPSVATTTEVEPEEPSGSIDPEAETGTSIATSTDTVASSTPPTTASSTDNGISTSTDPIDLATSTEGIATTTKEIATSTKDVAIELQALLALSVTDRARLKSEQIAGLNFADGRHTIDIGEKASPISLEIQSVTPVESAGRYGIELYARAWRGDTPLAFGQDGSVEWEHFYFWNPPVMVADDSGEYKQEWINDDTKEVHQRGFRYDPKTALLQSLAHTISVTGQPNSKLQLGKYGNTTSVFYPDADPETSSFDGWTLNGSAANQSWASRHDDPANQMGDSSTIQSAASFKTGTASNTWWDLFRGHFLFDTSTLPDNSVVATTTLALYGNDKRNDCLSAANGEFHVVSSPTVSNTAVSLGDYSTIGTTTLGFVTYANFSTSGYNNISLNATGNALVTATGVTKFGTRLNADRTNTQPQWCGNNRYDWYYVNYADVAGTTNDPKLIVEHYTATTTPPVLGVGIQNLTYTYDAVGNITRIVSSSTISTTISDVSYQYDSLNRLLSASTTNPTASPYSVAYSYNALGNILTNSQVGSYGYSGSGYANPHAPTTVNSSSLTYDNNGNLTGNASSTYAWDYRNRLTESDNGAVSTYAYDHTDHRVRKVTSGLTTYYPNDLYDTTGSTSTKTIYGGEDVVATIDTASGTSTVYYVHNDHLGGTNLVTDSSGTVVQTLDYYPYGNHRIDSGTLDSSRQYIGEMFDQETDLSYLNARYYESNRGQFLSQDPSFLNLNQLHTQLTDPQSWNSYSYTRNNPLTLKDPSGEFWWYGFYDWSGYEGVGGVVMKVGEVLGGHSRAISAIEQNSENISKNSVQYGIDQRLVEAIVYEEQSHLQPDEILGREILLPNLGGGGVGLMQVSGSVGKKYNYSKTSLARKTSVNINAGVRYLSDISTGNIQTTAARYNGSGASAMAYADRVMANVNNPNYNKNILKDQLKKAISKLQKALNKKR